MKGSDCVENFRSMQECMQKYPELYPQEDDNDSAPSGGADTIPSESTSTDSLPTSSPDSAPAATENPAAS